MEFPSILFTHINIEKYTKRPNDPILTPVAHTVTLSFREWKAINVGKSWQLIFHKNNHVIHRKLSTCSCTVVISRSLYISKSGREVAYASTKPTCHNKSMIRCEMEHTRKLINISKCSFKTSTQTHRKRLKQTRLHA